MSVYSLQSLNGVFVNGKKIKPFEARSLIDQDIVQLGVEKAKGKPAEFVWKFCSSLKVKVLANKAAEVQPPCKENASGECSTVWYSQSSEWFASLHVIVIYSVLIIICMLCASERSFPGFLFEESSPRKRKHLSESPTTSSSSPPKKPALKRLYQSPKKDLESPPSEILQQKLKEQERLAQVEIAFCSGVLMWCIWYIFAFTEKKITHLICESIPIALRDYAWRDAVLTLSLYHRLACISSLQKPYRQTACSCKVSFVCAR